MTEMEQVMRQIKFLAGSRMMEPEAMFVAIEALIVEGRAILEPE